MNDFSLTNLLKIQVHPLYKDNFQFTNINLFNTKENKSNY